MGLISVEAKANWGRLQNRKTTQVINSHDSALLLLKNQPRRRFVSRKPLSNHKAKAAPVPLLPKVEISDKLLGKRPRESDDSAEDRLKKRRQEDDDLSKRRRVHEEQLRKRRQDEIKKQKEVDELKKIKQQQEIDKERELYLLKLKREQDETLKKKSQEEQEMKNKREQERAAARQILEKVENDAKKSVHVQDHHKIMREFAALINYAPDQYNYFYP